MDVKQSQKAGNNAIQIQQTVVGDNNYEPMNRSDQPMPKVELKLKGEEK